MATDWRSEEVFPPGNYLREELQARGWTQQDLAAIIGKDYRTVNELVTGRRSVTPDTAVALAAALGTTPEYWLNLDASYQLWRSGTRRHDDVARRAHLYTIAPISDMIRRGWISPADSTQSLENALKEFYQADDLTEPFTFHHAARKSSTYENVTPEERAWLFRCRWVSRYVLASKYQHRKLGDALRQLKPLMSSPQEIRQIPKVLGDSGIRLVVVEHLPGTKIDGATFWLSDGPVVALSVRYNRIDSFWFTLLHELGHVDKHTDSMDVDVEASGDCLSQNELQANAFAAEQAVPQAALDSFIARVGPIYNTSRIQGFAYRQGVHAGVVAGQLHHRGQVAWSHYRRFLVPIRAYITASAVTDGWGTPFPVDMA